jgi:NADPH:quinone reductase-like Zn-dependent oxidoreductase
MAGMKALRLTNPPRIEEVPSPRPGPGGLLIRVHAAGVTPGETGWYPTTHTKTGALRTAAVPGHEFSGESIETGQLVFGMNDWFSDGATAEFCVAPQSAVLPKPSSLTHAEAATVPIAALTAWQGLVDRARIQRGDRVLIHGGAGAVGMFAVQLARIQGAHVIATAAARDRGFLSSLGAKQVIDYHASRFEHEIRDIDVLFDTVGGETLMRSWSLLKPHGRAITIASSEASATDDRTKNAFFIVEPNGKQLAEIALLFDQRHLKTSVAATVSLADAAEAYAGKTRKRVPGKIVVVVSQ